MWKQMHQLDDERVTETQMLIRPCGKMGLSERFYATMQKVQSVIRIIRASEIIPKKIKWLWPNRIPQGKLSLLVGDPDNGKSLVATHVAAKVTTGQDWFDAKNSLPPAEVLFFASEDDYDDTIVPRLKAAGADLRKVHFGAASVKGPDETTQERQMRLDEDMDAIQTIVNENPNIRAVVIDPVSNHLGDTKMTDEQAVRRILTPLQQLAAKNSVAIIGVMHLNKKADLNAINRVGGAMAFVGVARAVWFFVANKQNPEEYFMLRLKNNIVKHLSGLTYRIATELVKIEGEAIPQPYVEWISEANQSADAVLAPRPIGRPNECDRAAEWLKEILSNGPIPSNEVKDQCEAADFTYRTLERVKDAPNSGVEAFRNGDKWYWRLGD